VNPAEANPTSGGVQTSYFCSSTFQYASLTNFDQLSTRTSWAA
jgi:hypothetical protein